MSEYRFRIDRAEIENRRDNLRFEPDSGMAPEELIRGCERIAASDKPRALIKAELLCYIFENARLELSCASLFADRIDHNGIIEKVRRGWSAVYSERFGELLSQTAIGNRRGAYSGYDDFGHTCPDWESLLSLGLRGCAERLGEARLQCQKKLTIQDKLNSQDGLYNQDELHSQNGLHNQSGLHSQFELHSQDTPRREDIEKSMIFYQSCETAYRGLIRLCERFSLLAGRLGSNRMRDCFAALAEREPRTLYEAMQLIALVYRTITHVECEPVRSLGRLDKLLLRYCRAERDEDVRELFRYFLVRFWDKSIPANIPLTLGGCDIASDPEIARLDILILDVYHSLDIPSPKIQLRVGDNTPDEVIDKALELIIGGTSSLVLCNDNTVISGLEGLGHTHADAVDYVMIGCYEPSSMGREVSCTCNGRVSLAKAVETALNGGCDLMTGERLGPECRLEFDSFDELYCEVKRQAAAFAERSAERTTALESLYPYVNPSPLLSGSMSCCIDSGRDVYEGGARYNFSSVNIFGTATAADSLAAIKRLVFDERRLTLAELREILKADWSGHEKLRLICRQRMPKYGCGDSEVDRIASELLHSTAKVLNGRPNGRGGSFRAGAFSIDWRIEYGGRTAASADGRHSGDPLSKNLCASDGCDRGGVTAMITSACVIDSTELVNGAVLDLVLHPTAVEGDDGLTAMRGLVKTFMKGGGAEIQFNIFSPETLRDAQAHPEQYSTLQVRLCGWNVFFVDLSRAEQDEFIRASEAG